MTTRRATITNRAAGGPSPNHGGLADPDIDGIRRSLAAGRRPKVIFTDSAGQIAGQTGQVVQLTDPDRSDEWLVVRFGGDELPFSPADLAIPPRGRAGKRTGPAKAPAPKAAAPSATAAAPATPVPAPRGASRSRGAGSSGRSAKASGPATKPSDPAEPSGPTASEATRSTTTTRRPAKRATKSARRAAPTAPASITVTLAYEAGRWTVAAHQGSRTLTAPSVVRPADALKMVALLDVPGVHDAVEQIVTAELAEAQRRADTLRSELAEVEARLAELREAG